MNRARFLVGLLLAASSCGDPVSAGDAGTGDAGADADVDLGPVSDVNGSASQTFLLEDGTQVTLPVDYSKAAIVALTPDGMGGLRITKGTGRADGTFTVPSVPEGSYYFSSAGGRFAILQAATDRNPTFNLKRGGRPDVVMATAGTKLTLQVSSASMYQSADSFQILSPGAAMTIYGVEKAAAPATNLTAFPLAVDWSRLGLVDQAKGDSVYLTDLVGGMQSDGTKYQALQRVFTTNKLTIVDSADTPLMAPLSAPSGPQMFTATLKRQAFRDAIPSISSTAADCYEVLELNVQPGASQGFLGVGGDLAYIQTKVVPVVDVKANVPYAGNPFPASWDYVLYGGTICSLSVSAPGKSALQLTTRILSQVMWSPGQTPSVAPLLTPVRNPTIGGQDAFTGPSTLTGSGLTPMVAWSAPLVGPATFVSLEVFEIATVGILVADVNTAGSPGATSLQIPPGALVKGKTYFALLAAQTGVTSYAGRSEMVTRPFSP